MERDASVVVLHAGMVTNLVQRALTPALASEGLTVLSTRAQSVELANGIKEGRFEGDVFLSAGASVNDTLMGAANGDWVGWYVVFAHNAIVLAYSPESRFAAEFDAAREGRRPWYEVLTQPGVRLGRDDPNLDPRGYYALFVSALAERHYGVPDLRRAILGSDTNPAQVRDASPGDLSGGDLDARFMYESGAVDAGLPYLSLPKEIDLSDPGLSDTYATVSYTTDRGQVFRGSSIDVAGTILNRARNPTAAVRLFALLLSPRGAELLRERHLRPARIRVEGDPAGVPAPLRPHLG